MILGVFASQIAIKSNVSVLSFIRQFVTSGELLPGESG